MAHRAHNVDTALIELILVVPNVLAIRDTKSILNLSTSCDGSTKDGRKKSGGDERDFEKHGASRCCVVKRVWNEVGNELHRVIS